MTQILRGVGVNPTLAAAVERLLDDNRDPAGARKVVEQQLVHDANYLGFDALTVFDNDGIPRAGVMRVNGRVKPLDPGAINLTRTELFTEGGELYELSSVTIHLENQVLGSLAVGDRFDLAGFPIPLILLRNGGVLQSSVKGIDPKEIESAFAACASERDCEKRGSGANRPRSGMMAECNGSFRSKHCSRDVISMGRSSSSVSVGTRVSN